MMKKTRTRRSLWLSLALGLVFVATVVLGPIDSKGLDLADMSLQSSRVAPLRTLMPRGGRISPRFFMRTGGVAFDGVAEGVDDWEAVDLRYLPDEAHGRRLYVLLKKGTEQQWALAPIQDWQMIPIARYADSEHNGCVTLFGEPEEGEPTTLEDGYHVGYHPAFENTLVGLRLVHADFMLIYPQAADLPTERSAAGRSIYVLGRGESRPDVDRNENAQVEVMAWQGVQADQYQSYLITDEPFDKPTLHGSRSGAKRGVWNDKARD